MQLSHAGSRVSAVFDEPNLVSSTPGWPRVVALAARAGLLGLVADCIDDMDLLRHGGMARLFVGLRARSAPVIVRADSAY